MDLKLYLSEGRFTKKLYSSLRTVKRKVVRRKEERKNFSWHGVFEDRQRGKSKLCVVLAGYKEFLYDVTFERIKAFVDNDVDVCVATSGRFLPSLQKMCEKEGWSYLSTKENNVALVQNVAIKLHPKAEWIFKLDEDIFVTKDYFKKMMEAFKHASSGSYIPGVIAPLIPVNGYGHVRILEKLKATNDYAERFEFPHYSTGAQWMIEGNPQAAKFMWGDQNIIPSIDEMNRLFQINPLDERACAIRFSIGAIMFRRSFWDEMGHFKVHSGNGMALDEIQLCKYCAINNRPIMVSENIVVGHLSFGRQNAAMEDYFLNNRERFRIHDQ